MAGTRATPTHDPTATARDLVVFFRRLRARLRQLPSGELTPSQTSVLIRLSKDGASSTTVLAVAEGVRSQSMTATLNSLVELGLVRRRPDPEDGRRSIVTLSAAGTRRAGADKQGRNDWLAASMRDRFSPDELATIDEALVLLDRLIEP